jgi:hypothetical protein
MIFIPWAGESVVSCESGVVQSGELIGWFHRIVFAQKRFTEHDLSDQGPEAVAVREA